MIITSDKRHIENSFPSGGQFVIRADGKAFKTLISNLYSDKARAVLTELSANCLDAHIAAGCPEKPFKITFPTSFEPNLVISDEGTGIPHDQMVSNYCVLFQSSKDNSNAFIGAKGLGRMSALSISDSYILTSICNSRKYSYLISYNEQGIPQIQTLGDMEETAEPNGVTISIPVRSEYVGQFESKAMNIFKYYDVLPIFTNSDLQIKRDEYLFKGSGWGILGRNHTSVAVSGTYAYPIDRYALGDLTEQQNALLDCGIVLFCDIGKINSAASREAIDYDNYTIQNIKDSLNICVAELADIVEDKLKNASLFEKIKISNDLFNYNGALGAISKFTKTVLSRSNIPNHYDFTGFSVTTLTHRGSRRFGGRGQVSESSYNITDCNSHNVFYYCDSMTYYKHRARKIFENNSYARLILLKAGSKTEADFEAYFGVKMSDFPKLSELEFDKISSIRTRRSKDEFYTFNRSAYYARDRWVKKTLTEDDCILYVDKDTISGDWHIRQIENKISFLESTTGKEYTVVRMSSKEISKLANDDDNEFDIQNLDEVYLKTVEDLKEQNKEILEASILLNRSYDDFPVETLQKLKLKANSIAARALEEYNSLKTKTSGKGDIIHRVLSVSSLNVEKNCEFSTSLLTTTYPLLKSNFEYSEAIYEDLSLYIQSKNV